MPVVGVNLTKVNAEKSPIKKSGKVSVNNNFLIKEIEDNPFIGDDTRKTLRVHFGYACNYDPDIGRINLEGNVLVVDQAKAIDDFKAKWEKEKTLPKDIMQQVTNTFLHKCNVQAIKISEDLNLPPPVYLPRIRMQEEVPPKNTGSKTAAS